MSTRKTSLTSTSVRQEGHYIDLVTINEEINYDSDERTEPEAKGSDIGRRVRGGANGLKRKPNDPNTLTPKHL